MASNSLGNLRDLFDQLDTDKNGCLEMKDLRVALKKVGAKEEDMKMFLEVCDKDGDKKVTFEEFKQLCEGKH